MPLHFHKYHGAGNDFIILDGRSKLPDLTPDFVAALCERHLGIGADGLIVLENEAMADFRMRYFNADGYPGSLCGNGGRCVTKFAADQGIIQTKTNFLTSDGIHHSEVLADGRVRLGMKDVSEFKELEADYVIDTGSPHYIKYVEDLDQIDVIEQGQSIRNSEPYKSEGINVNFVSYKAKRIFIRTYERGVEAETLACGTGVTAVAIAHCLRARLEGEQSVQVHTLGGMLEVDLKKCASQMFSSVYLTGPATHVFSGTLNSGLLQ